MKKTVLLVILDGWGIGSRDESNPIYAAKPQNIQDIKRRFLLGSLHASGIAVGLPREEITSFQPVLPGVRFAVDAYVNFARRAEWHEAASSSLTELFAPKIHQQRLSNWPEVYPWVEQEGYIYFRKRLTEAPRDVIHGLELTLDWYKTREQQERMLEILKFKLDVLWSMADAMYMAYVANMPPYFNIEQ